MILTHWLKKNDFENCLYQQLATHASGFKQEGFQCSMILHLAYLALPNPRLILPEESFYILGREKQQQPGFFNRDFRWRLVYLHFRVTHLRCFFFPLKSDQKKSILNVPWWNCLILPFLEAFLRFDLQWRRVQNVLLENTRLFFFNQSTMFPT